MQLAIFQILVNPGAKSILHLPGRPPEFDPGAAAGHALNLQPLRLEPGRDPIYVILAKAEAVRVLLRREPLMVFGGGWSLLLGQQLFESSLLACRGLNVDGDSRQRKGSGHRPLIELCPRAGWRMASQHNGPGAVDPRGDAVRLREKSGRQRAGDGYKDDGYNKAGSQANAHKVGVLPVGWMPSSVGFNGIPFVATP